MLRDSSDGRSEFDDLAPKPPSSPRRKPGLGFFPKPEGSRGAADIAKAAGPRVKRGVTGSGSKRVISNGFTLIEIMVALAVFGLAALALLRLQGVSARSTADIERRALGQIVANNIAVEAMTDPAPPSLGTSSGAESNGGLQWRWTRTVARTADVRIVRIDVGVIGPDGRTGGALTVVRRTAP